MILLDINMPVMDGLQFCRSLDAKQGRDGIAVIIMTAARDAAQYRAACGADGILGKPFQLDDLYSVVDRYIGAA